MGVLIWEQELIGNRCGEYDSTTRTATIDPTVSSEQHICTLQHELIHAKHYDEGLTTLMDLEREELRTRRETTFALIRSFDYMAAEQIYEGSHTRWPKN